MTMIMMTSMSMGRAPYLKPQIRDRKERIMTKREMIRTDPQIRYYYQVLKWMEKHYNNPNLTKWWDKHLKTREMKIKTLRMWEVVAPVCFNGIPLSRLITLR